MKKFLLFILFINTIFSFAQVKGVVTDDKNKPLAYVNIFVQNTYISTISNDIGIYELNLKKPGTYVIVFQYLGFKSEKKVIEVSTFPHTLNISMVEEEIKLKEVVINKDENPANAIIKNAIANKKSNSEKTARYKADFYSRGIFRVKNLPKTILGQKLDFFDEIIDSTRSGILYLSETVSKITFQKPDKLKEVVIASKVSGNDNGFSFNSAASANFDFYENNLDFNVKAISPIADNAFNYYKYKLEGYFVDENNNGINKIKVTPKRITEPAFDGYIYIVDDTFAIYAVDLSVKGSQIQNPGLNTLTLKQNYSYNTVNKFWAKNTQVLDFDAGIFGINMSGRFTYVYSNFEFEQKFDRKTFTSEVLKIETDANKKENSFWENIRPVPLTNEETTDYTKKDALQEKKKSKTYLDSIDAKRNRFNLMSIISGYSYNNSFKKWSLNYDGPMLNTSFNTVQGWNTNVGLSYFKRNEEKRSFTRVYSRFEYGFSEKKFRASGGFIKKFNNTDDSTLSISGGSMVSQFNPSNPISKNINTTASLFFVNNFMKIYEKNFITTSFSKEIVNGINASINLEYSERNPLFNTTNHRSVKSDDVYTSNNPLLPFDFVTPAFEKHNLIKASVSTRIKFGQQYWTRPDGKFNIGNEKYPTLTLNAEKGLGGSEKKYEFSALHARIFQNIQLGNKGFLDMNLKAGTFFNADGISFVDYKHFNGNQTHISSGSGYTNVFNNLPYYAMSINDKYLEMHFEHNDNGFFMNKIPLLNKLQSQLVLGFHNLSIPNQKPYQEFTVGLDNLGFGKFRMFRVDYVRSNQNGYQGDAVIFGLKFLNIVE